MSFSRNLSCVKLRGAVSRDLYIVAKAASADSTHSCITRANREPTLTVACHVP